MDKDYGNNIFKKVDITALVAIVALIGSLIGWVVSVEQRLSNRVTVDLFYQVIKDTNEKRNTDIKFLSDELNDDYKNAMSEIKSIHQRIDTHIRSNLKDER